MVSGCGMNGRSRESRSSSGGPPTRKHTSSHNQRAPHKPRPPAEALQMARILEDSKHTSELNSKVQAVLSVVPGCTEEQIHLALHDNGYDLDKAISALLDSDGQTNEGEWTTTSSRKARKKGALGDTDESTQTKTTPGRPSNRAASSSTRESHGGSVTVSSGRGRGQSNRSKGQSAGKRTRVGVGSGDQRRGRNRDRDKSQSTLQQPLPSKVSEEWDVLPVVSTDQGLGETSLADTWDTGGVWTSQLVDRSPDAKYWAGEEAQEETEHEQVVSEIQSVFPEAIPGQEVLHSTPSEITPSLPSTGSSERDPTVQQTPSESRDKVPRKPKRLARSQIPKKPVEMPAGVESLDVQFGELGIDFVGLDTQSPPPDTKEIAVETGVGGLLPYSDLQQNFGESSISISTSSSSTGLGGGEGGTVHSLEHSPYSDHQVATEGEPEVPTSGGLRSPPGLPHPSSSGDQQQVDPTPTTLPLPDEVANSQQSSIDSQLHLQEVPSSTPVLKQTSIDLPLELPSRQTNPTTTAIEQQPFSSVATTGSDKLLFSSSPSVTPSVTSSSATSSRPSSVTPSSLSTQHHQQHLSQQQGKPGGSGNVPPGMLYPHMVPAQYPFIPAPAMYNYDPTEMSRYSSGSMAYFPTSSDPTMGGTMASRDHTSSVFPTQSEQAKFPRGGADLSSSVAVSSTQQSQQGSGLQQQPGAAAGSGQMGPAFMGAPFYGSMFYPTMYGPMPAFSQAANFGVSYEDMVAAVAAGAAAPASHDYSKMYVSGSSGSLNKPSALPVSSSGGIDSASLGTSSFKHIDSNKSFNYSVPTGVGGSQAPGYYMQMPFPHMMVGPGGHEVGGVAPHSRISQQKHSSKVGGYQGNSGSASYWGSAATHTS